MLAIDTSVAGCAGDMLIAGAIGLLDEPHKILTYLSSIYTEYLKHSINLTLQTKNYQDFNGYMLLIDKEFNLDNNEIKSHIESLCDVLKLKTDIKKAAIFAFNPSVIFRIVLNLFLNP